MCLGLPGLVITVDSDAVFGQVEIAGVVRRIDLSLLAAPFAAGDHVLVHSGMALQRLSPQQARESENLFAPTGDPRPSIDPMPPTGTGTAAGPAVPDPAASDPAAAVSPDGPVL